MSTYRDGPAHPYTCAQCGRTLTAEPIAKDLYIPAGGHLVWHTSGEIVLCKPCARNRRSWPWWAEFGLEADDLAILAARYDANYPPGDIPPADRCWS